MPVPRLRSLLDELDGGRHAERVRTLALIGRDNTGDPDLEPLLDELSGESHYHLHLALVAAAAAGDRTRLQAAVGHPSPRIRSFAFAGLARLGLVPAAVREAMLAGSADDRRRLRVLINRARRADLAEAIIDDVRRELGDREAGALLSTCGDQVVRTLLPEILYAVPSLPSLAQRHPDALFDYLEGELVEMSQRRRNLLWYEIDAALPALAHVDPDRLLRLVREYGPTSIVPSSLRSMLGRLVRAAPALVAPLVAHPDYVSTVGWALPLALCRQASSFSTADRITIARALREREHLLFQWIELFAPSERAALFAAAFDGLDTSNKIWAPVYLEVLPRALRQAEARRILGLRTIRESDLFVLQYTAFLSFDDAREALVAQLRRPRAEDRALGYHLMISCARRERSPAALAEALALCSRLHNEQDPVRLSALQALGTVHPSLVTAEHLADLQALVTATIEARDTSPGALQHLVHLAFGLLGDAAHDPASERFQFALAVVDQLAGPTGSLQFPRLDRVLPRGSEVAVIDALMPRLERDAARDRYYLAMSLAQSLGRRAWAHQPLQSLLERATGATGDSVARRAIALWLADPRARAERVGQLVANDKSVVAVPDVLAAIVSCRQDLLDVVLRRRPIKGRFLKGAARYVPVTDRDLPRWLPRQCASYRTALEELIADEATRGWSKVAAIRALAQLPEIGADAIAPFLEADDVAEQEAALSALAWTDQPGLALTELLRHAGTDRARVAVYAATRCARFVPRDALGPPLVEVLERGDAKITAKKEAARLLGAHRPPGAVTHLLDLAAREGVHRDVRVAIGRSLRSAFDDERVWSLQTQMAAGPADEARSLLETAPVLIPPRHRPRYAALVLEVTKSATQAVRSEAYGALAAWGRWAPDAPAVAGDAIDDLDTGPEWRAALRSLAVMLEDGAGWVETTELVSRLAGRADAPELDAGVERDRPSAQRLGAVLAHIADLRAYERERQRDHLLRIADVMGEAEPLGSGEVTIRLAAIDWSQPPTAAAVLATLASRLDEQTVLLSRAMGALAQALGRDQAVWDEGSLGEPADDLIDRATVGAGALALQLVQSAGARFDWPAPWRARLRALRAHPSAELASLAREIPTAPE